MQEIFSNLQICDNSYIGDNWYYNVRSLFEILNANFKKFASANNFSVDESIDLDSKLCCLCSCHVYAEPYCGSETDLQETGIGQCPDVVVGFIDTCTLKKDLQQLWIISSNRYLWRTKYRYESLELAPYMKISCKLHH